MEERVKALSVLSKKIDLNQFYSIRIDGNEIILQGWKEDCSEVISKLNIILGKIDDLGYVTDIKVIDDITFKIIIT